MTIRMAGQQGGEDQLMGKGEHKRARVGGLVALVLAGVVVGLWGLAGCEGESRRGGTSSGRPIVEEFRAKDENPFQRDKKPAAQQEVVHVIIYQVRIRDQDPEKAAELWSLFRPTRLVGKNGAVLARNGLGIGSGDAETWKHVSRVLGFSIGGEQGSAKASAVSGVKVRRRETWLGAGLGAELAVSGLMSDATLFRYEPDGHLVGETYEESQKLLVITAGAWPGDRSQIQFTPVLKGGANRLTALRRLAMVAQKEPERYVAKFDSLVLETLVSSDEFLIIGSSPGAAEMSFGRAFFDEVNEQGSTKMILLVIPQVVSAEQMK